MWHIFLLQVARMRIAGVLVSRTSFSSNVIRFLFATSLPLFKTAGIAALPVVKNRAMMEIYSLAKRISASSIPVLITGETGVGKEVVARYIHENSKQSHDGQFVCLNCAAIPESLIESELFGYVKGVFTGAEKDKIGLMEIADKGTLFLDEVGEMTMQMQAKLIRAIETKEYVPVGSTNVKRSSFRLLCATTRIWRI